MMTTEKPKVRRQGNVIVECHGGDWFVLLPDGSVEIAGSKGEAERVAKRWFKANADDGSINVGTIEWRGC